MSKVTEKKPERKPAKKSTKGTDPKWTLVAVLLILAGLILLVQKPEGDANLSSYPQGVLPQFQSVNQSANKSVNKLDDQINFHLKAADVKAQLEEAKARAAVESIGDDFQYDNSENFKRPLSLSRKGESHAVDITKENDANDRVYRQLNPSQLIDRQMAKEQFNSDYNEKYREEYIRQFIENARSQGIDIKLNDDLEVVEIQKRPLEQPLRFPNSVGSVPGASK